MELFIIRHAQASYSGIIESDFERPLTPTGHIQAKELGTYLKEQKMQPELILASPYARAQETAKLIAEHADVQPPITEIWLAPGMRPESAIAELQSYSGFSRIAIVGHQPDLSYLMELLDSNLEVIKVDVASLHEFTGEIQPNGGHIRQHR